MDIASQPIELLGYAASLLVFITFCMKTLLWLRVAAIASNLAFIGYALGAQLFPILILHGVLLPMNILRLWQHFALIRRVKSATRQNPTAEALLPFMQTVDVEEGQTIFRKGQPADRLYYIQEGSVQIVEFKKSLKTGEIFGEIGLFSEGAVRTATTRAGPGAKLCQIDRATVLRIYREHPEFGFAITRLVTNRLIENQNQLLMRIADLETEAQSNYSENEASEDTFAS
ncbi:Crp/Fnr family transcriptional regulator [Aestuariivita boseongensis]|uniref:Crp/Fnr family transcriptional regulator n=1 Tax=Aestuariivita boseongensis TaxID=1470562 RepID=UPI000681E31B|nr:cyclic nucleotide-binding domain-containing protein [Aestuariivita boseongensis]